MKRIVLLSLLLFPIFLFAQYPTFSNKQKLGVQTTGDGLIYRGRNNPNYYTPSNINNAYFYLDTLTSKLYLYNISDWQQIYPTTSDTTSLGNFLLKSDTLAMLLPYLRKADTISLSNRINNKLNATDTVSLSNRINLKLNQTDTINLSNRIDLKLNKSDTISLSNRINTKLNTSDTVSLSNRINKKLDTIYIQYPSYIDTILNKDTINISNTLTEGFGINIIADSINIDSAIILATQQKQIAYVKNQSGVTMYKGQAVYSAGSTGNNKLVELASSNTEQTSSKTFGVVESDSISNGSQGYIITFGLLNGLNTDNLTEGSSIYLSTTPGQLTTTKPQAPLHLVTIGVCIRRQQNNGSIFVKIQNGFELNEIHDVLITNPVNNASIYYNNGLWRDTTATLLVSDTASMLSKYVNTYSNQTNINGDKTFNNIVTIDSLVANRLDVNSPISSSVKINSNTYSTEIELMNSGGKSYIKSNNKNITLQTDTTALVYLKGDDNRVGILTMSPQQALQVAGNVRIDSLNNNLIPSRIVGSNNNNDLTNINLGQGLSFTNDTLKVDLTIIDTAIAASSITLAGHVTGTGSTNSTVNTTISNGVVTNDMLAGSISDTKLNTITTAGKVSNSATTATSANTNSAIVTRDNSGNFSAGTITANLNGNATTATNVAYSGLTGTVPTWNQNTTGNAATVTSVLPSNFASQTANTVLAAPNGSSGTPTFRSLVSSDIPSLNYLPLSGGILSGSLDISTNNGSNNFQDSTLKVTYNQSSFGVNQNVTGIYSSVNTSGYTSTGILSEASTIYSTAIGVKGKATQSDINGPGVAYGIVGEIAASGSGSNGSTYAGYFNNTSTVGGNNYGLFVNTASGGDYGIYQTGSGINYFGSNSIFGGNIGIGNNNPTVALDILKSTSNTSAKIRLSTNFQNAVRTLELGSGDGLSWDLPGSTSQSPYIKVIGGEQSVGGGGLNLMTNDISRLFIRKDGNIGIGTINPSFKLDVNGTLGVTGATTLSDDLILRTSGGSRFQTAIRHYYEQQSRYASEIQFLPDGASGSALAFITNQSGFGQTERMRINQLGNVNINNNLTVGGTLGVSSNITANSFIKSGGTSSQFLKADGSVDNNTYLPLTGGTVSGSILNSWTGSSALAPRNDGAVRRTYTQNLYSSAGNTTDRVIHYYTFSQDECCRAAPVTHYYGRFNGFYAQDYPSSTPNIIYDAQIYYHNPNQFFYRAFSESESKTTWSIKPNNSGSTISGTRADMYLSGNETIDGNTSIGGTLGVTGATTLSSLSGTGNRMVTASSTGVLSTQAIPSGTITSVSGTGAISVANGTTTPVISVASAADGVSGIVTNQPQQFSGNKHFLNNLTVNGVSNFSSEINAGFNITGTNVRFSSYPAGTLSVNGSGVVTSSSDSTLKIADGYIDSALVKINKLTPRYYYWKDNKFTNRQLGFFAQEVNSILGEEAAPTPTNGNKYGIYDISIVAYLVKAVQEQQVIIDTLKSEIDKIKEDIVKLKQN